MKPFVAPENTSSNARDCLAVRQGLLFTGADANPERPSFVHFATEFGCFCVDLLRRAFGTLTFHEQCIVTRAALFPL
jgi:hypothetical protein